uniref:Transmembrane anterior posterior transformation 1b n=1 Tax=Nothobranchius furzeri TaxID=105023 RepID=A0A1A8ANL6_NOTFU
MADSLSTGLGEEKEQEKGGNEKERNAVRIERNKDKDGVTETLGFNDKNGATRGQKRNLSDLSLGRFITTEITRGYFLEHNEAKYTERREKVYTCLRIPKELEKLMTFGFFLCLDTFLYVFTLLPLRVVLALLRLVAVPCCGLRGSRLLQPAQVCDVLKGFIMVLCYSMMSYVDYSMMYHLIRGQSVIKLYIIYNMLEVADRLFSSFGQDILDALYWTATEPKEKKRAHIGVIPHFLMAVLYVFLHAILIMVQATTLNVAFNSHNKSLLTIMMSNNFVEIKGSVFKKFEKNNLFQMSNSDIKERFTNYILLLIVCLRNMEQFSWNPDHLWVLFPDVVMVITSEVAVDVVKHAFITKFNDISADVSP